MPHPLKPFAMLEDFITGRSVPNIGAEENRQALERYLVERKGYARGDIEVDVPIEMDIAGERYRSAVDLVVGVEENNMSESIRKLTALGQSIWYDNIQRKLLENGELKAMIERGDIRGVTSNPSIFNAAIAMTNDYDSALTPLAWAGWDAEKIFWQLAIEDIKAACDAFAPLYEESKGGDGYVSLEVSPYIAHDAHATVSQAEQLWARVARKNLMVKIPATKAGHPCHSQGDRRRCEC